MTEYRSKVLGALSWRATSNVVSQVISLCFGIALARLLSPEDFGLIAMVMVLIGFAGLLSDVGLGAALVQEKQVSELQYSTVFWTNLALGSSLTVIMALLAESIAQFYESDAIADLVRALAVTFFLSAASMVQRQRLVKSLKFKLIAMADLLAMIAAGSVAVWLALRDFGHWALVWQILTQRVVSMVVVWIGSRWMPSLVFSINALKGLLSFSAYVFATQVLQNLARHIDKLLTGKFLGASAVGLLDKAQSMMLFPLQNVSHVIGSVMFPALSMVQDDIPRVRIVYLKSTQAIAFLTFPMIAGIFTVSENFVLGVLGSQWEAMIPILQILSVAGFATSIVTVTGTIYLSQGQARLQFKVNLITRPLVISAVAIGLFWGVIGVATSLVLATWVTSFITLSQAGRLIELRLVSLLGALASTFVASIAMAVIVFVFGKYSELGYLEELAAQILLGMLVYFLWAVLFRLPALTYAAELVRERINKQ